MSARPKAGPGDRATPGGHKPSSGDPDGLRPPGVARSLGPLARRHRLNREPSDHSPPFLRVSEL